MRIQTWFLPAALAAGVAACQWTEFDDIAGETWVNSTEKPDLKSSDYGVAIQRGADPGESASSGTLAVIGAGPGTYSELLYSAQGSSSLKTNSLDLGNQGIMALDSPPILIASPTSAEVALVTTGDTSSIVVATGSHTLLVRQLFVANTNLGPTAGIGTTPDAATYMRLPSVQPEPAPLVAVGDVVMGTIYAPAPGSQQPACKLTDGTNPIQVRAVGAIKGTGNDDDLLVWNGADGKLLRYSGAAVFNGCATAAPAASTDMANKPAFLPGRGSQILVIDDTHVLLQGHQDITRGNASFLQVYDVTTLHAVGTMVTTEGLRSAAVLGVGASKYAVAGYPQAIPDDAPGGVACGAVRVFPLSPGIDSATPAAVLHDAQPDNNQQFGRSVAIMPYNGAQVIAVAAGNEIFVYFRARLADGTSLYDETRQGK